MFSMLKRTVLVFLIFFSATSQASAPKSFARSAMQSAMTLATTHPWWTAYTAIGVITGSALVGAHYIQEHDFAELKRLKQRFSDNSLVNRNIAHSFYSSSHYIKTVISTIESYNKNKGFKGLAEVESAVDSAITELKRKNENEKSYKTAVIIPYLVLGALGAGISWFWSKK